MISYQLSIRKKVQPCDGAATFDAIISSPEVADLCNRVNILKDKAGKSGSEDERRLHLDEANAIKRKLPCFIYQANFPGTRRLQKEAVLNGLCMVDYDGIADPAATLDEWFQKFGSMTNFVVQNQIFLIHITPSGHGIRLVMMADASVGNLADNQARLDNVLGLKHDGSCKDSSRISYAFPKKDLVFLNEELFTFCNPEFDRQYGDIYRGGKSAPTAPVNKGDATPSVQPSAPSDPSRPDLEPMPSMTKYHGVDYADIIRKWWELNGGEPQLGERNAKLLKLAASLRYICDQRSDMVKNILPKYGLSDSEVDSIVKNACHYAIYQSMPRPMRAVLDALDINTSEADSSSGNDEYDDNVANKLLQEQFGDRFEALRLPPVFKAIISGVPQNLRIGAVYASLPMFYTLATGITFRHFDGVMSRLSGMTFIVGPAASGKSFILELDELLMYPVREADKTGRLIEEEYKRKKEKDKNKQKQAEKPRVCIRIVPIQVSNTMLAQRARDAKNDPGNPDDNWHYHLYHIETELATAVRAQKGGSWIEKNDIYCKSFHNERWGMDYANDQAVNGEVQVNLNMVVSGTEGSFDSLVNNANIMGGLPTRLMYYPMPFEPFKMIPVRHMRTPAEKHLLSSISLKLNNLKDECEVNAKTLVDRMYKWCADKAQLAEMSEDYELDDLRKRSALIGERAGVIFAIIENIDSFLAGKPLKISRHAIRFALFISDFTLQAQYMKFASRMKECKLAQATSKSTMIVDWIEIYNSLGPVFTTRQILADHPMLTMLQVKVQTSRWKSKCLIRSLSKGCFEKISLKIERKQVL